MAIKHHRYRYRQTIGRRVGASRRGGVCKDGDTPIYREVFGMTARQAAAYALAKDGEPPAVNAKGKGHA